MYSDELFIKLTLLLRILFLFFVYVTHVLVHLLYVRVKVDEGSPVDGLVKNQLKLVILKRVVEELILFVTWPVVRGREDGI